MSAIAPSSIYPKFASLTIGAIAMSAALAAVIFAIGPMMNGMGWSGRSSLQIFALIAVYYLLPALCSFGLSLRSIILLRRRRTGAAAALAIGSWLILATTIATLANGWMPKFL